MDDGEWIFSCLTTKHPTDTVTQRTYQHVRIIQERLMDNVKMLLQ